MRKMKKNIEFLEIYDPSAKPQTRDLFKIESKTSLPGSGSQDLAANM